MGSCIREGIPATPVSSGTNDVIESQAVKMKDLLSSFDSHLSAQQQRWGQQQSLTTFYLVPATQLWSSLNFFVLSFLTVSSIQHILDLPLFLLPCTLIHIALYGILSGCFLDIYPNHHSNLSWIFCNSLISCPGYFLISSFFIFCSLVILSIPLSQFMSAVKTFHS